MSNPLIDFAMKAIAQNPMIANNPRNAEMFSAIQNGDKARGEEIARNLCESYGVTPEEALKQAKGFFGLK